MTAPANNSLLPQQFFWDNSVLPGKIWAGVPASVASSGYQLVLDVAAGPGGGIAEAPLDGVVYGRLGSTASWLGVLPLTGGTVSGQLTVGDGTGTSYLTLNGVSGAYKGVSWRNVGTQRWALNTDGSDNLGLYAYASDGTFIDTGLLFTQATKTLSSHFGFYTNTIYAVPPNQVAGVFFNATNTGLNPAQGHKLTYTSASNATGFDIGATVLSIFNPASFVAGQRPAQFSTWVVAVSPNDPTNYFSTFCGEWNVVNRGADQGWMRDRAQAGNPTGGLYMVPESVILGASGGGEGKNVTFGFSTAGSASTNSTGFRVKFYNNYLVEPNSTVGLTGRGMYMTGDITAVASQYPYGPLGIEGTWLHGFDHTTATYVDNHVEIMKMGQGLAWINGTVAAPTATATIAGSGSGVNASIVMTPAGSGTVSVSGAMGVTGVSTLTGSTVFGNGAGFGSQLAPGGAGSVDLSKHLALYGSIYGLNVTSGSINVVVGSTTAATFTSGGYNGIIGATTPLATGTFTTVVTSGGAQIGSVVTGNAVRLLPGASGAATAVQAIGVDANVNLNISAQGTGGVRIVSPVGFNNTVPVAKPAITGAKGSNAALASLLTALASYGLITDSTTA